MVLRSPNRPDEVGPHQFNVLQIVMIALVALVMRVAYHTMNDPPYGPGFWIIQRNTAFIAAIDHNHWTGRDNDVVEEIEKRDSYREFRYATLESACFQGRIAHLWRSSAGSVTLFVTM